jgi:hypothetical protein
MQSATLDDFIVRTGGCGGPLHMTFSETVAGSCISSRLPKDMSPYRLSLGIPGLNACAPTTFFALRRSAEENGFGFIFTSAHFLFRLLDRPAASPAFLQ